MGSKGWPTYLDKLSILLLPAGRYDGGVSVSPHAFPPISLSHWWIECNHTIGILAIGLHLNLETLSLGCYDPLTGSTEFQSLGPPENGCVEFSFWIQTALCSEWFQDGSENARLDLLLFSQHFGRIGEAGSVEEIVPLTVQGASALQGLHSNSSLSYSMRRVCMLWVKP